MIYTIKEIRDILEEVCDKYNISKAGIFGSYAKGTATEKSDIDLLIEFNESFDLYKYNEFIAELNAYFEKNVDVLDYRCIWEVFRDDILNSEVRLYEHR